MHLYPYNFPAVEKGEKRIYPPRLMSTLDCNVVTPISDMFALDFFQFVTEGFLLFQSYLPYWVCYEPDDVKMTMLLSRVVL